VTGNLKFDVLPGLVAASSWNNEEVLKAFCVSPGRTVLIAASTHSGEESFILDAFARVRQQDSQALLVVAPRHPERWEEIEALSSIRGFETVRRSELPADGQPLAAVVVLDTVGELAVLYQIASIVFLGGSLVPVGGHNVLEPASWGKPVVFGPHMHNFSEITELFLANRAARQISGADELEVTLLELLNDSQQCVSLGAAAASLVRGQGGATERSLAEIAAVLPPDKTGLNRSVEPNSLLMDRNVSSRF
jgi:3-deoxy-D-manno-octulosonic-acid transferase